LISSQKNKNESEKDIQKKRGKKIEKLNMVDTSTTNIDEILCRLSV
jgi:hypothetical protein